MNQGIPDCIAAHNGRFALLELKVAALSGKVALSPHQVSFHTAHANFPCFIVVKANNGRSSMVKVYRAAQAMELLEKGTKLDPAIEGSMDDWEAIEKFLFSA